MRFYLGLIILFSIIPQLSGCGSAAKEDRQTKALLHLQLGTNYLANANYPLALKELLQAERFYPDHSLIQNNLGLAFLVRGKYDDAEKRFRNALTLDPKYTDARNNLGRLYADTGMYEKAVDLLSVAAADLTYSQPEKSWSNLGYAHFLKKNYKQAKEALLNSLRTRRNHCFTMNLYGRTLFELKEYEPAAESLDQAIVVCKKGEFDEPHFYSAMSLFRLGRGDMARTRFEEVVELYPKSPYTPKAQEMLEIMK